MLAESAPVVRPAVGGKSVELVSQALLITAVPAALGPHDYGTLALMLGVATVASSGLALGGPAAVSLVVGAAPAAAAWPRPRAGAPGLAWRQLAVLVAWAIALAVGAPPAAATLLALAAALDGAATTAAQATLAVGQPWGFALRWPVQNLALVVAALALRPSSAATAAATLVMATAAAAAFTGAGAIRLLPGKAAAGVSAGALAWRLGLAGALAQLQQRGAVPVAAALGVSSVQTGCAAVAVGAAVALITAVVQVFQIELPVAARRVAAGHAAAVRDRGMRLALGAVGGGAALALAGVLAGPPLIDAVLGDDFGSAGDALGPALAAVPLAPLAALGANQALLGGPRDDTGAAGRGRGGGVRRRRCAAPLRRQRRHGRRAGDAGGRGRRRGCRSGLRAPAGACDDRRGARGRVGVGDRRAGRLGRPQPSHAVDVGQLDVQQRGHGRGDVHVPSTPRRRRARRRARARRAAKPRSRRGWRTDRWRRPARPGAGRRRAGATRRVDGGRRLGSHSTSRSGKRAASGPSPTTSAASCTAATLRAPPGRSAKLHSPSRRRATSAGTSAGSTQPVALAGRAR